MESDALNFRTLGLVTELCDPGPDFGTGSVEFFEHWSLVSSNSGGKLWHFGNCEQSFGYSHGCARLSK